MSGDGRNGRMRRTLRVKFTFSYSRDLVFGVVSSAELTEDSSCCGIVEVAG